MPKASKALLYPTALNSLTFAKSYLLLSKNKPSNKFLAASAVGSSPGLNFLYISIIASS